LDRLLAHRDETSACATPLIDFFQQEGQKTQSHLPHSFPTGDFVDIKADLEFPKTEMNRDVRPV
jgi:hypothetical protein